MITRSLVAQCVIYAGTRGNLDIYLSWSGSPSKTFMLWRLDYKLRLSSDVKLLYLIYYLGDIHEPCDRFFFPFNFFFSAGKPQYLHPRINSLWSIWKKANNPPIYLEFSNAISTWAESPTDKKKYFIKSWSLTFFIDLLILHYFAKKKSLQWSIPTFSQRVIWAVKLKGVSYECEEDDLSNKTTRATRFRSATQ
jgi:hypothetical protein